MPVEAAAEVHHLAGENQVVITRGGQGVTLGTDDGPALLDAGLTAGHNGMIGMIVDLRAAATLGVPCAKMKSL